VRAHSSAAPQAQQALLPLHALAWATLGVHYDWQRRLYPSAEAGWCSPFPAPLAALCSEVAASVQAAAAAAAPPAAQPLAAAPAAWGLPLAPYLAHAAIVSLYHASRSRERLPMGGHKDDAAGEDQRAPVVSFSLGATAVFLLGGADKSAPPTPLLLRSGDVMLLAGQARDCVHGVPRVLCGGQDEDAPAGGAGARGSEGGGSSGSQEERALSALLATARINVTVRSAVHVQSLI
jgi:alkylated DNA repair protein alkB family protein 1